MWRRSSRDSSSCSDSREIIDYARRRLNPRTKLFAPSRKRNQRLGERRDRWPSRGITLEASHDHSRELLRNLGAKLTNRSGVLRQDIGDNDGEHGPIEGPSTCEHLVRDRANSPDVGLWSRVARALQLLGRHVFRSAKHELRVGSSGVDLRANLRETEVEDLHGRRRTTSCLKKDVLRLEVSMNDSNRMRLGHGRRHLKREANRVIDSQPRMLLENVREIVTFEELHHEVGDVIRRHSEVVHTGHVLAFDVRPGPGFTRESRQHGFVGHPRVAEEFDRDAMPKTKVDGLVNDPHSTASDFGDDSILVIDHWGHFAHPRPLGFVKISKSLRALY